MSHPEVGTAVESRKPEILFSEYAAKNERLEVILDEDRLKIANGSSLLLVKSQIFASLCFYLRALVQRGALVRFSCPAIRNLQHTPKTIFFPAFDFQPPCLLQGEGYHMINA
jgi:hypothetical protein